MLEGTSPIIRYSVPPGSQVLLPYICLPPVPEIILAGIQTQVVQEWQDEWVPMASKEWPVIRTDDLHPAVFEKIDQLVVGRHVHRQRN